MLVKSKNDYQRPSHENSWGRKEDTHEHDDKNFNCTVYEMSRMMMLMTMINSFIILSHTHINTILWTAILGRRTA